MIDPSPVIDAIDAFRRSKTMFVAVDMKIFDRTPATTAQLATALNADADALGRLLDACVGMGFLERDAATEAYRNTPTADTYLRWDSPNAMVGYILHSDRVLYEMWGYLKDAIREGTPRFEQAFGNTGGIFSHFYRNPESTRVFLAGMHGYGCLSSPEVVRVFNLNRFTHLVDLGGGTGHLAIHACERYGNMSGTVFDLPNVLEHAQPYVDGSRARDRLTLTPGDFFKDPLPAGDLYAVGRILHDWTEAKIQTLLSRIYAALPPGGALLVAERLLDEDRSGPLTPQLQSLNMLVCTEGKERTPSEYRVLLEAAGFTDVEARVTGAPLDAILAHKSAT